VLKTPLNTSTNFIKIADSRTIQRVTFIAVPSTAAATACTGGCRLSNRWSCRARYGYKRNFVCL